MSLDPVPISSRPDDVPKLLSGDIDDGIRDHKAVADLENFWDSKLAFVKNMSTLQLRELPKILELPLARTKKIMKLDENAKNQMVSSEVPMLLSAATEFMIQEMTLRSWIHTDQNRRKTIQKFDLTMALASHEVFDFLIDILPRSDQKAPSDPSSSIPFSSAGISLDSNGHMIQATPIGPPIPVPASASGQPMQMSGPFDIYPIGEPASVPAAVTNKFTGSSAGNHNHQSVL